MTIIKCSALFIAGFVCASCLFIAFFICVLIPYIEREKLQYGINVGYTKGLLATVRHLEQEFGKVDGKTPCKQLFSVKDCDVVSIEIDGIKTIRVIY